MAVEVLRSGIVEVLMELVNCISSDESQMLKIMSKYLKKWCCFHSNAWKKKKGYIPAWRKTKTFCLKDYSFWRIKKGKKKLLIGKVRQQIEIGLSNCGMYLNWK